MISVRHVSKVFGGNVTAVQDVSFDVSAGQTVVLIGLSGCGKTTTMKMLNRLVEPDGGSITIQDRDVRDWDPITLRRNIGYVIQEIGLMPHFTIAQNVGMVLTLQGHPPERVTPRVEEMLDLVGLPRAMAGRYPAELSGGQRQRVGVARALAADPDILLMDEPFGALDPITREELQDEFLSLEASLKKTIVMVTHDIFEAVKMGDMIAVMNQGRVEQFSPPAELIEQPATEFVRRFLGRHHEILKVFLKNQEEA